MQGRGRTAAWREVRDECVALPDDAYEPWVQREMYGEGWSVYGLVAFGRRIEAALRACPRTAALVGGLPRVTTVLVLAHGPRRAHRAARRLGPLGVSAPPRLVVPEGCTLRVGDEVRRWRDGECLVFDDTAEHDPRDRRHSISRLRMRERSVAGCSPTIGVKPFTRACARR